MAADLHQDYDYSTIDVDRYLALCTYTLQLLNRQHAYVIDTDVGHFAYKMIRLQVNSPKFSLF